MTNAGQYSGGINKTLNNNNVEHDNSPSEDDTEITSLVSKIEHFIFADIKVEQKSCSNEICKNSDMICSKMDPNSPSSSRPCPAFCSCQDGEEDGKKGELLANKNEKNSESNGKRSRKRKHLPQEEFQLIAKKVKNNNKNGETNPKDCQHVDKPDRKESLDFDKTSDDGNLKKRMYIGSTEMSCDEYNYFMKNLPLFTKLCEKEYKVWHKKQLESLEEKFQKERQEYLLKIEIAKEQSGILTLPKHWPDSCSTGKIWRIQVPEERYKEIKTKFERSFGTFVSVTNIEEICNVDFYERYQVKKRSMRRKLRESPRECYLYHGTNADTIPSIAMQNFDWRLCGKNATYFGEGSYFAKNASYSHRYSSVDDTGTQYMFWATVLVGRSAVGKKGMKRPPALSEENNEFYDSCVNDINNPSIYVIFERDQCYPRYLISYKPPIVL